MKPKNRLFSSSCFPVNFVLTCGLAATGMIAANAATWNGLTNQDWNTLGNWDVSPGATNLTINTATGNFPIITANPTFTPVDILIGVGAAGRLDQRAGTAATGNGNWFVVGRNNSGNGTFNLADTASTGGTLTGFGLGSGSMNVGGTSTTIGRLLVGDAGSSVGTVNVNTSGTLKMEQDDIGILLGNGGTTTGNVNLDAGTVQVNSIATNIGILAGTNGGDGNFRMSGGTVNVTGGVWLGDNNINSQGLLQISGGSFNVTASSAVGSTGAGQVFIGRGLGQGTMNVSGTANVTITGSTNIGFSNTATTGTSGSLTVSGGTFSNSGELRVGSAQNSNSVIAAGTGTFNVSGGTATIGGNLVFGRGNDSGDLVTGQGTVSGGTLTVAGDMVTAYAGNNNLSQFTVSGGTVNVGTSAEKWLHVNQWDTSRGQITVSSGNLNLNTNSDIRFSTGNSVGASSVTLSGGAITSYSGNGTGTATSGVVDLNQAGGTSANNTFNLNGGTLTIAQVITNNNNGTAVFNFNGGTLKAANASANFVDLGGASQSAKVLAGGALIDTNGYDVTIPEKLLTGATTDGGLTKSGNGKLTLTGANTYNGQTKVNQGTLSVVGLSTTSGVTVAAGAAFEGRGTVSGTTTLNGASLTNNSSAAVLTLGALSMGATGNTINLNMAGSAGIIVTGGLTTGGFASTINAGNTVWAIGNNALISYGSFSGAVGDFSVGTITGLSARQYSNGLVNTGSAIALDVGGDLPVWSGANGGVWTTAANGDNSGSNNWGTKVANTATNFWAGDVAEFGDTVNLGAGPVAPTTTTVTIAGGVSPTTTTFNNSALDYTITSSDSTGISSGSIIKSGSGKLTINTANTFTGGTSITGGRVVIAADSALGASSGALTLNGGSLQTTANITSTRNVTVGAANGSVITDSGTTYTNNGLVSGSGSLTKGGDGTLVLGGANTYSGGTMVNAGTLQITSTSGAANTGSFTLNGGNFQVNIGSASNFAYAPTINLSTNSTIGNAAAGSISNLTGQINFSGTLNGGGNALTIANTGLARLYMNGTHNNVSQFNVQSGAMGFDINSVNNRGTAPVVVSSGAAFWFAGTSANPVSNNLTFNGGNGINSGGALYYEGGSANPAALSGTVTLASGNTGIGTNAAADTITLSGTVTGSGALTQIKGNLTLSGANDYSGGTTIASGTTTANHSSALGSGAVSISALSGNQLKLGGGVNVANALTINGGGVTAQGVLYVPTGDATYSGSINITGVQALGGHFASGTGTLTLSGPVSSSVPVTVRNGTVVFSGTGNSFAALTIQQGTVKLGASNAIPSGAAVDLGISGAAAFDLAGYDQTLAGITKNTNGATVTNSGATDSKLAINGNSTFSGLIQDGATNKTLLEVAGGTFTLSGSNTYTGATSITGGKLVVNGSISTSVTTVSGTGTLGGSGSVGSITVASGGTLAPGNSPGILNTGNVDLQSGSNLDMEINGTVAGTDYDQLNVTGTVTLAGLLNVSLGYTPAVNDLLFILLNDGTDAVTGTFSGLADGSTFTLGGSEFKISYFADSTGNSFTGGNDVALMVVPEPGAALLGGLGMLALLRRRRVS